MYTLIYILIIINLMFINLKLYKTIIKTNILFSLVWCFSIGISSLGLFEIYKPSNFVQLCSLTLLITFNLTYYLVNIQKPKKKGKNITGKIMVKYVYIFNFIAWAYTSKFLIKSMDIIINGGGFKVLRMYAYNSKMGLGTTAELLLIQVPINAIFTATIIIAAALIAIKKYNYKIIIIAIIDTLIYTLIFGGRGYLFNFTLFYIFAFLIIKQFKNDYESIKFNKKVVLIVIIILILITAARSWSNIDFLQTFVVYFTGGFNNLSMILSETPKPYYLYGKATFGFIINIILMGITLFLGGQYNGSDHIITSITSIQRNISPSIKTNTTTTIMYPFLMDLGYIGIIIGAALIAIAISIVEKRFKKYNSLRMYCIYIYILYILSNSILTYHLLLPSSGITMILIFLFTKNSNEFKYL